MTDEKSLAIADTGAPVMPVVSSAVMLQRYRTIVEIKDTVMQEGVHYGVIPGSEKPSLWKPGAETLCTAFHLVPEFEPLDAPSIQDVAEQLRSGDGVPFIMYRYRCTLKTQDGKYAAGSGIGSCNSWEKKYRYRSVPSYKVKGQEEEYRAKAIRVETRNGKFGAFEMFFMENEDIAEVINTLDKMAQKRALVAATLVAVGASNFFTQDIEDLPQFAQADTIDGEVVEPPADPPAPKAKPKAKAAPPEQDETPANPIPGKPDDLADIMDTKLSDLPGSDLYRVENHAHVLLDLNPHHYKNRVKARFPDVRHIRELDLTLADFIEAMKTTAEDEEEAEPEAKAA